MGGREFPAVQRKTVVQPVPKPSLADGILLNNVRREKVETAIQASNAGGLGDWLWIICDCHILRAPDPGNDARVRCGDKQSPAPPWFRCRRRDGTHTPRNTRKPRSTWARQYRYVVIRTLWFAMLVIFATGDHLLRAHLIARGLFPSA